MQLRSGQLGLHGERYTLQILGRWVQSTEQFCDLRIANRKGGGKREYAISEVFLSTPSQRLEPLHVADIVAAVIKHAEQVTEFPQPVVARGQTGAGFEH